MAELEQLVVADQGEWRRWLDRNHATSPGVRLVLARKGAEAPTSLTHPLALEEALCYGWIDSTAGTGPPGTFVVRFTPRRPRSVWSRRNTLIVERLTAEGRMQRAGLEQVELAKSDGRWARAYAFSGAETPADLAEALARNEAAAAAFERLSAQNRFSIIFRLAAAKRPETRRRRLDGFVEMLARGDTPHPQRRA